MSSSRLARYFKGSRDNWKNKALEKQKKLRVFEQKIRDLEKSREQWKSKAKKAEKKRKELERELEKSKKTEKPASNFKKTTQITASLHHYTIETIQLSVQQVINGGNSYRSVATTMKLLSENFEVASPHFSSIRKWVGRDGSNLKKGIKLYQKKYPEVIYTYDVTHAMSNLLKQQLSQDESYHNFLEDCHKCRLKLQQTELAFLAPPSQRSQCRYFNVERLVNWGKQLLNVPLEVIVELMPQAELKVIHQRLKQKLSWLINYEEPLRRWEIMVFLTRSLETQLKIDGLNQQCLEQFESQISSIVTPPDLFDFKQKIIKYISEEISHLKMLLRMPWKIFVVSILKNGYIKFLDSQCSQNEKLYFRQLLVT